MEKERSRRLRELLHGARYERREITLQSTYTGDTANIDASGALRLTLNDFLENPLNSAILPDNIKIQLGVSGNEVWPYNISDVTIEETGEVESLNEQTLSFARLMPSPQRLGISIEISNLAIDNAGFDVYAFVKKKFSRALYDFLAKRIFSNEDYTGIKGPFAGLTHSEFSGDLTMELLYLVQTIEDKGFPAKSVSFVMDYLTERYLKCTPIVSGEGRMFIENGLFMGYPYIANKYFNTTLDSNGALVSASTPAVGLAVWDWLSVQQHGQTRLTIDGVSEEMAIKNKTAFVLNTEWSITDLSGMLGGLNTVQAFAIYDIAQSYLADTNDLIFETADGLLLTVQ